MKTTSDLLVLRSDAYELTSDGRMKPSFDGPGPVVTLDKDLYKLLPGFEQRFPAGPPSLRRCRRFQVDGDVTFGAGVVAVGDVRVRPARVTSGTARYSAGEPRNGRPDPAGTAACAGVLDRR